MFNPWHYDTPSIVINICIEYRKSDRENVPFRHLWVGTQIVHQMAVYDKILIITNFQVESTFNCLHTRTLSHILYRLVYLATYTYLSIYLHIGQSTKLGIFYVWDNEMLAVLKSIYAQSSTERLACFIYLSDDFKTKISFLKIKGLLFPLPIIVFAW